MEEEMKLFLCLWGRSLTARVGVLLKHCVRCCTADALQASITYTPVDLS